VKPGLLSWSQLVEKMAINPARVVGLNGDGLVNGHPANLTIVNPDAEWLVEPERFISKGKHSAFRGWTLTGRVVTVIRRGVVMSVNA